MKIKLRHSFIITTILTFGALNNIINAQSISAVGNHSLFLCTGGTVQALGTNTYGQLGDGTTVNKATPILVPGLTGITSVAGGSHHSLFLKNDGTVWAWGGNNEGELGDSTIVNSYSPVQVLHLSGITAIAAGVFHSLAIKNDSTVWAWGYNPAPQPACRPSRTPNRRT